MRSLVEFLEHWSAVQPAQRFSCFLNGAGTGVESYTYRAFNLRTRHVASHLSRVHGLRRGDRVLLVYPPGLELVVAFLACARLGIIPVPAAPPTLGNFASGLAKLSFVATDCNATTALTHRRFHESYQLRLKRGAALSDEPELFVIPKLRWVATDVPLEENGRECRDDPDPILFLQYTSGSTSDPRGVVVSHANVIHNAKATLDHIPIGVSWLPQYHDMGLIGNYLFPLVLGGTIYGFAPLDFLKRPLLWLQTLSKVRATSASAPNFGYEYCLREDKIPSHALAGLDLSSVRLLMNAAEPIRAETHEAFSKKFARCGLNPAALVGAYGLAENTLTVTNHGRRLVTVDKLLLRHGRVKLQPGSIVGNAGCRLVSCGPPVAGVTVKIVQPESRERLADRNVGEIWLAGESTCQRYWNRPDLSDERFGGRLLHKNDCEQAYLRTGDLGFLDEGELFVCGRIKDLLIVRGVNYHPHEIEAAAEQASPAIRSGGAVAFPSQAENESLVLMLELGATAQLPNSAEIAYAVRTRCGIEPELILYVRPKTLSRTSSGKLRRGVTRQRWIDGKLSGNIVAAVPMKPCSINRPPGLRACFRSMLESYQLTGCETATLAATGLDSLTFATLLVEIEQLLRAHGAAEWAEEVDGRLLQRLTVAELAAIIEHAETASITSANEFRSVVQGLSKERTLAEQAAMRADANLEILAPAASAFSEQRSPGGVLLTGPTGFFGPFLLASLLRQTDCTYHVLVRAQDRATGLARVRGALQRSGLWSHWIEHAVTQRVQVVCGDMTQPQCGVSSAEWRKLSATVKAVIHNAAQVNYVSSYETLRAANVEGTRELLRFAACDGRKAFHFISSTAIFGWNAAGILRETDSNTAMQSLDFGYAQSKWVAEQLVFAAERQGLPVRVYRPSFLSASTSGVGSSDDIAVRLLAFMINHGIAVNAANQISFLPADIAAENIAAVFSNPLLPSGTLHVTADRYSNMPDITRLITRLHGQVFRHYDIPEFVAELKRRCTPVDPLYPLLDFLVRSQRQLTAMQDKRYGNEHYQTLRSLTGKPADPALEATVSYLLQAMAASGLIAKPADRRKHGQVSVPAFSG